MVISNKQVGSNFEIGAQRFLETVFGRSFTPQGGVAIGNPPKAHKFDFISDDGQVVAECKCLSWTKSGNIPSAKISVLNEAVFYLGFLSDDIQKVLVVNKAYRVVGKETLGEYYVRRYGHLLGNIKVLEADGILNVIRILN